MRSAERAIYNVSRRYSPVIVAAALAAVTAEHPSLGWNVARTLFDRVSNNTPGAEDSATHRRWHHVPDTLTRDAYDRIFQTAGPPRTDYLTSRLTSSRPRLTREQRELGLVLAGEWAGSLPQLIETVHGLCPRPSRWHR